MQVFAGVKRLCEFLRSAAVRLSDLSELSWQASTAPTNTRFRMGISSDTPTARTKRPTSVPFGARNLFTAPKQFESSPPDCVLRASHRQNPDIFFPHDNQGVSANADNHFGSPRLEYSAHLHFFATAQRTLSNPVRAAICFFEQIPCKPALMLDSRALNAKSRASKFHHVLATICGKLWQKRWTSKGEAGTATKPTPGFDVR